MKLKHIIAVSGLLMIGWCITMLVRMYILKENITDLGIIFSISAWLFIWLPVSSMKKDVLNMNFYFIKPSFPPK